MIEQKLIPDEYCVDHLLLLIGANPLPNYVAARLLAKPMGTVHLLHTVATIAFAKAIETLVRVYQPQLNFIYWELDMVAGTPIRQQIQKLSAEIGGNGSVGLHYTGGTKAMAVHTYHTLAQIRPNTIFSYLDAQTLTMRIESADVTFSRKFAVRFACDVSLEELLALHDYATTSDVRTTVAYEHVVRGLAEIHAQKRSHKAYRNWYSQAFVGDNDEQRILGTVSALLSDPQLQPLADALNEIATPVAPDTLGKVAGFDRFASAAKWFNGEWLEEYTLLHLRQAASELKIPHYTIGLEATKTEFADEAVQRELEMDLAAIWGYQLFVISCRATDQTGTAKEHLLEAVIRARQVGGDEAKSALVCCSDRPEQIEIHINEGWFQGERANQVRVFGRKHLPDLAFHLREWFESSNTR